MSFFQQAHKEPVGMYERVLQPGGGGQLLCTALKMAAASTHRGYRCAWCWNKLWAGIINSFKSEVLIGIKFEFSGRDLEARKQTGACVWSLFVSDPITTAINKGNRGSIRVSGVQGSYWSPYAEEKKSFNARKLCVRQFDFITKHNLFTWYRFRFWWSNPFFICHSTSYHLFMSVSLQLSKRFALQTHDTSVKLFYRIFGFLPAVGEKRYSRGICRRWI